tara:strand:- start:32 stop:583 length:552 start_codon:yes stop_codon:yes gene_type:complete
MSHIGKKSILIPDGVDIIIDDGNYIVAKGKLGELSASFNPELSISRSEDNSISISIPVETKKLKELHGLTRALIANMVIGVSEGYSKELKLVGVGYSADASKGYLLLNLGFSHPIYFQNPDMITFETPSATSIIVKGIDKQAVGQVSAKIRSLRKPEPYKGKGIRYSDEVVRRKAGKKVAGAA